MTNRKLIGVLGVAFLIGVLQCWLLGRVFGLDLTLPIIAICATGVLVGWTSGAVYIATPVSPATRWRGTMRALLGILGGTTGFAAMADSVAWKPLSLATAAAFVLSYFPIRWKATE